MQSQDQAPRPKDKGPIKEWEFSHEEFILRDKYWNDIYLCPYCHTPHKVKHGCKPVLPFCWNCRLRIDTEDHSPQTEGMNS